MLIHTPSFLKNKKKHGDKKWEDGRFALNNEWHVASNEFVIQQENKNDTDPRAKNPVSL